MKVENKKQTQAVKAVDGKITLTHHQSVRQSHNYQSAEASYGATITVEDTPATVKAALDRLENIVEGRLSHTFREQFEALKVLSGERK